MSSFSKHRKKQNLLFFFICFMCDFFPLDYNSFQNSSVSNENIFVFIKYPRQFFLDMIISLIE